jgi:hypothetical protein
MITAKNLFTSRGGVFTGKGLSVVEIPDDIVALVKTYRVFAIKPAGAFAFMRIATDKRNGKYPSFGWITVNANEKISIDDKKGGVAKVEEAPSVVVDNAEEIKHSSEDDLLSAMESVMVKKPGE